MVMWLSRSDPFAKIEKEEPHEVIVLHAGPDKVRAFCNWIYCPYEEIIDAETADQAVTEHESLNE